MKKILIFSVLLYSVFFTSNSTYSQTDAERQNQYLADILKINIKQRFKENTRRVTFQDSTWQDWLIRTKELPPDFSQMRSVPMLPDPLTLYGKKDSPLTSMQQWEEKREWIKREYKHWIAGEFPPPPQDFKVEVLSDKIEDGTRVQMIKLSFGPGYKGIMTMELMFPAGTGPFPVYMTQWTHRGWAQLALKRGYIACVYAAADGKDDTQAYQALYPDYDFSMLMRRAWGASRVIDYLMTRDEVDQKRIAITGHSRNGKQSLWAAAFDDRIAAVVSSSSSTGGDGPWRYGDPQYASETLDYVTALNGHWFHPRLNFFFGREDKLPVDQNLLGALIAPRALLYHYSIVESGLNSWANEQNYYSVKTVYEFMNVPENIGVLTRMGDHAVAARDVEKSIDFLDVHFKKSNLTWQNDLFFKYSYTDWKKENYVDQNSDEVNVIKLKPRYADKHAFEKDREKILKNLNWILGDEPSGVKAGPVEDAIPSRRDWIEGTNPRPVVPGTKQFYFGPYSAIGDHIGGILYCPADESGNLKTPANGKLPVIIYSHQYAHSTGFSKGYDKVGKKGTVELFKKLTERGFAVLAIDMYGFGTRIEEASNFYSRYPKWSKMGKMIRDVRGCIDAVEGLDYIDNEHIFLLGNTIGGAVSLMATALDSRVSGTAAIAAFSPWRSSNSQYESIRTYSHLHGFIPRIGQFADNPNNIPIDFSEIIATIAPKPVLIIAPDLDRYTDISTLQESLVPVKNVYSLYGKEQFLTLQYPHEINRATPEMYTAVADFFTKLINK